MEKENKQVISCKECKKPHPVPVDEYPKHVEAELSREYYCSECDQTCKKFLWDQHVCPHAPRCNIQWLTREESEQLKKTQDDRPPNFTYESKWIGGGCFDCSYPSKTHNPPVSNGECWANSMIFWPLLFTLSCLSPYRNKIIPAWISFGLGWILLFRYNVNGERCVDCGQVRSLAIQCSSCATIHCWWCSWKTMRMHILDWGYSHYDCANFCSTKHWLPITLEQKQKRKQKYREHQEHGHHTDFPWHEFFPSKLAGKPGLALKQKLVRGVGGFLALIGFFYSLLSIDSKKAF